MLDGMDQRTSWRHVVSLLSMENAPSPPPSDYFLAFQILYAKFYAFFNVKWIFLIALFIFEVGSLICAVSPTSNALIVGRAIAGLGGYVRHALSSCSLHTDMTSRAGIFTGVTTAITWVAPKELRPMLTGIGGGIYGFSSVFGPVVSISSFISMDQTNQLLSWEEYSQIR